MAGLLGFFSILLQQKGMALTQIAIRSKGYNSRVEKEGRKTYDKKSSSSSSFSLFMMLCFLGSNFGLFPMGGIIFLEVFFLGELLKSNSSQSSQVSDSPAPQRLRPLGWGFFFTDTAKGSYCKTKDIPAYFQNYKTF